MVLTIVERTELAELARKCRKGGKSRMFVAIGSRGAEEQRDKEEES